MADTSHLISGVAERYATSLFELAVESDSIDKVASDLSDFETMLGESADLKRLVESPAFSADEQFRAIGALCDKAGIVGLVGNFLRVVARNRRLFAVPGIIRAYREMVAKHRGETRADVTSAHKLTSGQEADLSAALKAVTGKDVAIDIKVDPSLLGGLVVQIGSRQIDTSLRTKLSTLKLALKEVG